MTTPRDIDLATYRQPAHDIEPLFVHRWSPRAMSGEELRHEDLMALFEAARWAPSSYNNQPWRFLYAKRNTPHWPVFVDLMIEGNRRWAIHAAVLVVVVSSTTLERDGSFARTHTFDAGAAWENLALQAASRGLVVHGMQGFDYDKAKRVLGVPDGFEVEAMVAIGHPGRIEDLPERLQEREVPSSRKPLAEIVFEGGFPAAAS